MERPHSRLCKVKMRMKVDVDVAVNRPLKIVLNQPKLVGTMLIVLMVCGIFVYVFAFEEFNYE